MTRETRTSDAESDKFSLASFCLRRRKASFECRKPPIELRNKQQAAKPQKSPKAQFAASFGRANFEQTKRKFVSLSAIANATATALQVALL